AVDGDGDGAQVDEGEVGEQVLGTVAHHHQHLLAAPDAERGETRGEPGDALAHLGPGEGRPASVARAGPWLRRRAGSAPGPRTGPVGAFARPLRPGLRSPALRPPGERGQVPVVLLVA